MSNATIHSSNVFEHRHIGPREADIQTMLKALGYDSMEAMIDEVVPESIRFRETLKLEPPASEREALRYLQTLADENQVWRSYLGMGYAGCVTPPVIQRNILENPAWYTAYTPYQAEISQGRLEALLNFQTVISDLTGLPVANASLLDEATAAAEAMTFCRRVSKKRPAGNTFFVSDLVHPQTLAVLKTRAEAAGLNILVGDLDQFDLASHEDVFGCLIQYPTTDGRVLDYESLCVRAHEAGVLVVAATDLLALTLLKPPGEFGVDVAIGNSQRFGVPMGYGGPHAAFISCHEKHQRQLPGRLVGVSKDADGKPAIRMALQTREQHIRRDKATSNICTAQVLLAVIASMYAVYHGPEGLRRIARRVHLYTIELREQLRKAGFVVGEDPVFDTIRVHHPTIEAREILDRAEAKSINLREYEDRDLGVTLDETVNLSDLADLIEVFLGKRNPSLLETLEQDIESRDLQIEGDIARTSEFLEHPTFHTYHSETEFLRYAHRLATKDLALNTSMIPLGSCTMKLNAAAEMYPISFPGFAGLHPFIPEDQARGYQRLFDRLERWLAEITGFHGVSLMPNSGAQGEYTGLLLIRAYHESRGQAHRDICLIPQSAHGTNPASAAMAGMRVVVVKCDDQGNVDLEDLREKCKKHESELAALMITYPSTHGVFETHVRDICDVVHACGGQVYLDGANMNALVGLCKPGEFGADVCHLNLHKTFCIPHGGGGPGMGPVGVAKHLTPFLPSHPLAPDTGTQGIGAVSAAPYGSASILPISYAYIAMMGAAGLKRATEVAILSANYIAHRLSEHFPLLYRGESGLVAHECILDLRPFQKSAGITVEDVAKRLMDYGFHAPTMSWPVAGTLMVEPTESESLAELDRFCEAMIMIRKEIAAIENGQADSENNLLKRAPHTAECLAAEDWDRPYTREQAVFPAPWSSNHKYWPGCSRIDNAFGDRHVICTCPPIEAYMEA